jgi:hypothetical protein
VNRRELLIAIGAAVAACRLHHRPEPPAALDEHELATLAAMADTFLPGGDGIPAARDVAAVATIVEPAYGLVPYLSELVADLDQWCLATRLVAFRGLAPEARAVALEQRMGARGKGLQSWYRAAYDGVLALTKLAFCEHPLGAAYLGFPGASAGYAPASAAGAYASRDPIGRSSTIAVTGAGRVTRATLHAVVRATGPLHGGLRVVAPDGRHHDVMVHDVRISDELVGVRGAPAAGTWRLEARSGGADIQLVSWALVLRTELDDAT